MPAGNQIIVRNMWHHSLGTIRRGFYFAGLIWNTTDFT